MRIKPVVRVLKRGVESLFGVAIYRTLPHGVSFLSDLNRLASQVRIDRVVDVGANIGQSLVEFREWFPSAEVHCFEPGSENYEALCRNAAGMQSVHAHRMALGDVAGTSSLVLADSPRMHRLGEVDSGPSETVEVTTLDVFCAGNSIDAVSILKIDTEGHDLKVLQGADGMLRGQNIDFVVCEAGGQTSSTSHVPMRTIMDYMEARGYLLFGIYEQRHEWTQGRIPLRRVNLAFVSDRVASTTRTDRR